jgi:hypothetical protein
MALLWIVLLVDDAVAIFVVTFLGLSFHQMDAVLFERLPHTFIPYFVTWVIAAAGLQLYSNSVATQPSQLWRVPVGAAIAALPAAALRSLWLGTPLVPMFVLIMGVTVAVGLLLTRSIYAFIFGKQWQNNE